MNSQLKSESACLGRSLKTRNVYSACEDTILSTLKIFNVKLVHRRRLAQVGINLNLIKGHGEVSRTPLKSMIV